MPDAIPAPDPHHFAFELDRAIRDQVIEALNKSPMLPLTKNVGPQKSGIYALYFKGDLVYIGKASGETTKSKRTLRTRLNEHIGKLENRQNLSLADMTCRFLTIDSAWFTWAAEFALLDYYDPEWRGSGLGSKKNQGIGRPGTHRVSTFNQLFPLKPGAVEPVETEEEDEEENEAPPPHGMQLP